MKQLGLGAILYESDNNDIIPQNTGSTDGGGSVIGVSPCSPNWVAGWFAYDGQTPGGGNSHPNGVETNTYFLGVNGTSSSAYGELVGTIGTYAKAAGCYKCPADRSMAYGQPRVRSCSANCYVGTAPALLKFGGFVNPLYKSFTKSSSFNAKLGAASCFEFDDENPYSLNDGFLDYDATGDSVNDRPAVNHGRSSSFSFADGHAELHKWADTYLSPTSTTAGQDSHWLAYHGTCLQ